MKNFIILLVFVICTFSNFLISEELISDNKEKRYKISKFIDMNGNEKIFNNVKYINFLSPKTIKFLEKAENDKKYKYNQYILHRFDGTSYISNDLKNWKKAIETPDIIAFKYAAVNDNSKSVTHVVKDEISLNYPMDSNYEIVSLLGNIIRSGKYNGINLNLYDLNEGLYIIKINNNIIKILKTY